MVGDLGVNLRANDAKPQAAETREMVQYPRAIRPLKVNVNHYYIDSYIKAACDPGYIIPSLILGYVGLLIGW